MNEHWDDVLGDIKKECVKPVKAVYTNAVGELIHNTGHHRRTMGMRQALKAAGKGDQVEALYQLKHRLQYLEHVSGKK